MTMGWNKIFGVLVPLLVAGLAFLASMVPIILQRKNRNQTNTYSEQKIEYSQTDCMWFPIVGSVNSNNNCPYLAETLSKMLERTSELGIELNLNLKGCSTNG